MKSYTMLRNTFGELSGNQSTTNLALGDKLINDSLRYLTTKFFVNERTFSVPGGTVSSQGAYDLPYNIKTIVDIYVQVGNIRYLLQETPTRQFWDNLNFVPYTSDIPQFYFIFNKKVNIFPVPSSSGNGITIVYKARLTDLSQPDYTTGSALATNLSSAIVGTGTTWTSSMAGRWIQLTAPNGDGGWYEIAAVQDATHLTLVNQYQGTTTTSVAYTIGEMPILPEDYHDLPVYRALSIYYSSRVPDATRATQFQALYDEGYEALEAEFGSKSSSVAITPADTEIINPNLFVRNLTN